MTTPQRASRAVGASRGASRRPVTVDRGRVVSKAPCASMWGHTSTRIHRRRHRLARAFIDERAFVRASRASSSVVANVVVAH